MLREDHDKNTQAKPTDTYKRSAALLRKPTYVRAGTRRCTYRIDRKL